MQLHGGWDAGALPFRMSFEVMCEKGTLIWDSGQGDAMSVFRGPEEEIIEFDSTMGYAPELDYFLDCIQRNEAPTRTTPQTSREGVMWAREELRQIGF